MKALIVLLNEGVSDEDAEDLLVAIEEAVDTAGQRRIMQVEHFTARRATELMRSSEVAHESEPSS